MDNPKPPTPESAPPVAQNLLEVRRLCKMGGLEPHELGYWVDTDKARDPRRSLRKRIKTKLEESQEDAHLLVYGHGGSGKSTELVKLVEELGPGYFVVRFSVREDFNFAHVIPEDIPVVIAEHVFTEAQKQGLSIPGQKLLPIYQWFAKTTKTHADVRDSQLTLTGEAKAGLPTNPFVQLLASLKSQIKYGATEGEGSVLEVRKNKGELVNQVSLFLNEVRHALPVERKLLIIVEDMDKISIADAHHVFIDNASLLTGLRATIIYTIPIFTFHSSEADEIKKVFTDAISLPMIKVVQSDGKTRAPGFDTVKEVIRRRVPDTLLPDEALDLAVEKTGGVLQHVFEVIHTAASMTDIESQTDPLTVDRIQYGLQQKSNEFYDQIAIPHGGVPGHDDLKVGDLYKRLATYAQRQLEGGKNKPPTDPVNQILLKCCALVEYNGERWYGVHPLVLDILRDQVLI